jgi:hypothetical protein
MDTNETLTLPIYPRALREWVNYSDAYLFFMLYGQIVRERLERVKNRLKRWKAPEPKFKKGYLTVYSRLAEPAERGAALRYEP